MNESPTIAVDRQPAPAAPTDVNITSEKELIPLPEALRQIGRDSRKEPQQYLQDTAVPFGGE
jgi:hypothetical protein